MIVFLQVGSAAAQESGHKWTHYELETTHDTQQQALASARAQSGGYQYMTAIKKRVITETKVDLTYGIPTEISQLNEWSYTTFGVELTGPEQAFFDALKAKYDQKSIDVGCTPSSSVTRTFGWNTLNQWSDGTPFSQLATFGIKWNRKSSGTCSLSDESESATRRRTRCSNEYVAWNASDNTCSDDFYVAHLTAPPLYCDSCTLVGDPVDFSTGDQYETENDIDLSWISFDRYYHSATSNAAAGFGYGWTHSHDIRLAIQGISDPVLGLVQANGSHLPFRNQGTYYEAVDGSGDRITASGANWVLQRSGGSLTFNAAGQLLEQRSDNGTALSYSYDVVGRLITITHSTGRSLTIAYSGVAANAPITSLTSAGSMLAAYTYTPNGQVATVTYPAGIATRTYHYENPSFPQNLTGISVESIQGGARYSTFAYDSQGRSISAQLADGVEGVTVAYSAQGGAVVTNALGDTTDYSLTTAGAATKPRKAGDLTDSKGIVRRTYYDDGSDFRRRLNTFEDRNGTTTKHTYTETNDPVTGQPAWTHAVTEAYQTSLARTSEERRDSASNRSLLTKVGNRETRITRNARLQPASVTVRDTVTNQTRTTAYTYCEAADTAASNSTCPIMGMLKSIDGPRTDVVDVARFEYYGSDDSTCATTPELCTYRKGDLRKAIDALGRATEIAGYDPQGRPLSVVDANGVVTDYVYNPRGWVTAIKQRGASDSTETDDHITRISYYPPGMVETMSVPGNPTTNYNYDAALRLISFNDGGSDSVRLTLDKAGNRKLEETKTASGLVKRTRSWVYNTLGQLSALKDASQNATVFSYDKEGNLDLTTDAMGRKTTQSYDRLNRLISTLQDADTLKVVTKVEYNALDQVTKVTDPNGLDTVYDYNGFGDQTQLTSPDTGIVTYTYNSAGLLATKQDANDAVAHRYTYDALNRPTAVFYTATGPADVEYDYDTANSACAANETFAVGRVTAMRTEGTELKYCYDRFGQTVRKVQTVGGQTFTLRYAYYNGFLQSLTYPDGAVADYTYTTQGRIQEIGITPAAGTRSVVLKNGFYNPLGPIASWSYGNGRIIQRTYDLDYRPKTIRDTASGGLSLGYGYNTVGDLTELKDGLLSTFQAKYDYDALGRLTVTRDGTSNDALETYEYDKTGNRKKLLHGLITELYVIPSDSHRLSSVGGISRSYDAVGNTIAIGGTAKEYVYNANDRMRQVKQSGVVTMSYRYNAKGERVAAINGDTGPVTTYTLYDEAGHWIGDYDSAGATIQQTIWMDNMPVGLLAGAGVAQSLKYVQPDHLGTPRVVIDPTRNVAIWTWDAKSEVFGASPPNQDPDLDGTAFVLNMRFPGQRHDPSTGLNYNYFRDYDPATGRYIQSDPIGLSGGISTYSYAGAAPSQNTDTYGLQYRAENWENKYINNVKAPARSPKDWLGPTIGVGLGVIMLPVAWELGALSPALINPLTAHNAGLIAAEGVAGVSLGAPVAAAGATCKIVAQEITADEIRAINRALGGIAELTGDAETVIANMAYRDGVLEKAATAMRDIAGRHLFNDANKRTAQAVAERILGPSVDPAKIRSVIDNIATGNIRHVEDITQALEH